MSALVNTAEALDPDLLRRVEALAVKAETSLAALLEVELRYLAETYEAADAQGNGNFKALLDFSLGRCDDVAAMGTLGIDTAEDLFLLMARAHLPMPRLPVATTESMVAELHRLPA